MIEQHNSQLILTFPTADSATTFAAFLSSLLQLASLPAPETSGLPSGQPQETPQDFPEQKRSRHTVLTDERLEALSNQRAQGMSAHQRLLRAQTTLRDGTLPFKQLSTVPSASGQDSPRIKAQAEGGFADGSGDLPLRSAVLRSPDLQPADEAVPQEAERRKKSQLRPSSHPPSQPPSKS